LKIIFGKGREKRFIGQRPELVQIKSPSLRVDCGGESVTKTETTLDIGVILYNEAYCRQNLLRWCKTLQDGVSPKIELAGERGNSD
jgi:hypothetical protein